MTAPANHLRLKDRIALVTGASRGIGRAVAEAYAAEGAHVLLLARKQESLEPVDDAIRAKGGTASLIPLDLGSGTQIDGLGPALYERFGRLDIFVANAGVLGGLSPLAHIQTPNWERAMAINVNANWRLIRTLDPLLRRSDAGRCIFVSSGAARSARAYWGPYSVSKAALEALALTYANETRETPIRVNILDPGATATAMRAEAYPGEDPATLKSPESLADSFVKIAEPAWTETGQRLKAPF
ncbi:MAG: SDR family NAD(P)-dependent oxidoreductase [Methyloligella sp. ZOD6]